MKIYFAGPLFCEAEKEFNLKLCSKLEELEFEIFLPQRDGVESSKAPYDKLSKDEKREAMFNLDRDEILCCDIFLFVLDGRVPDEGAAVELGIAYCHKFLEGKNKLLVGLHTDNRAAFLGGKLNPMLKVPLDYIAESVDDLVEFLKERV